MKNKNISVTSVSKYLGITHSAVSQWVSNGKIPSDACIDLEPLLKIKPKKLRDNPNLLFDMFNNTTKKHT